MWIRGYRFDWFDVFAYAVAVLLLLLIGVAVMAFVVDARRPTFSLKKDDWSCTRSHVETYTIFMQAGKVSVPQVHSRIVCDEWSRR